MVSVLLVGELKNPQQVSNPPHDSFSHLKQAEDKHNVPASCKKVSCMSHRNYTKIYILSRSNELTLGSIEIKKKKGLAHVVKNHMLYSIGQAQMSRYRAKPERT